jgi:hypothetical protein
MITHLPKPAPADCCSLCHTVQQLLVRRSFRGNLLQKFLLGDNTLFDQELRQPVALRKAGNQQTLELLPAFICVHHRPLMTGPPKCHGGPLGLPGPADETPPCAKTDTR